MNTDEIINTCNFFIREEITNVGRDAASYIHSKQDNNKVTIRLAAEAANILQK